MKIFTKHLLSLMKEFLKRLHWIFIFASFALIWRWVNHGLEKNFDVLKPVVEGVVGGIVTTILLLVFTRLWKSNITPWFEHITYRDAKIEGVWQGFLVPYIGIEAIDRLRAQAAWRIIRSRSTKAENRHSESVAVDAAIVDEKGQKTLSSAELVIPPGEQAGQAIGESHPQKKKTILVAIHAKPIRIRAEFWRVGCKVEGRLIEIGGASQAHTYYVEGSFRNLILCGNYENENPQNIDRGSFSLMLKKMEGNLRDSLLHMKMMSTRFTPFVVF